MLAPVYPGSQPKVSIGIPGKTKAQKSLRVSVSFADSKYVRLLRRSWTAAQQQPKRWGCTSARAPTARTHIWLMQRPVGLRAALLG